jgi:hypothetical protein
MTASQIAVEVAIGLAFLVLGVFLREPFERLHEYLKRPSPHTPQTRGQWTTYLAMLEQSLERIDYLHTHPRDLYLYLFQLLFAGAAFDGVAFILFVWTDPNSASPQRELWLSLSIVLLAVGIVLATLGVFEANRLSQKRIDATRAKIKKQIDQYKKLLAEPTSHD